MYSTRISSLLRSSKVLRHNSASWNSHTRYLLTRPSINKFEKRMVFPQSLNIATMIALRRISTQTTPNPNSLKFFVDKTLVDSGSYDFMNAETAKQSPLAALIFQIPGVSRVFISSNFVTVSKAEDVLWHDVKADISEAIEEFSKTNQTAVDPKLHSSALHEIPSDSNVGEVAEMIMEILDTKVRPSVQDDGGDVLFKKFEDGVVYLKLMGSCSGCPSSLSTLKGGIESMLLHYVPEVKEVREAPPDEEDMQLEQVSLEQLRKLESRISDADSN
eukprot:TRINITY_DN7266_c0_g1_i1.p1 TRINITY_DN7266_c0_g1~~TRINITY_DN7266_c0_g1_i1.p1  ORF type:complete len:274 (+),score=65.57 TRINITY_DN7266_c0_g1_i1:61-882(+)